MRRAIPQAPPFGDLLLIFFIWYGVTRFFLETLRADNWTFFGIPMAQIVTSVFILGGVLGLLYRHGPGRPPKTPKTPKTPKAKDSEVIL